MDAEYEERSDYFENITVNYEYVEKRSEHTDFYISKVGHIPGENLAIVKSEDCPRETLSEVRNTLIPDNGTSEPNDLNKLGSTSQKPSNDNQCLEHPFSPLTFLKDVNIPLNEENLTVVSNNVCGRIGSQRNCNAAIEQSTKVEVTNIDDPLTDGDVIEIDDSSEDEIVGPLHSSDCKSDGPTSFKRKAVCVENFEFFTGYQQPPSCSKQAFLEKIGSGVFQAFENAMDDWYSKLSVHGPLKDCEIIESAQQLAQYFNFEFPYDAEWLAMFKHRHKSKSASNNEDIGEAPLHHHQVSPRVEDTILIQDQEMISERGSQFGETHYLIKSNGEIGRVSSTGNRNRRAGIASKGGKQIGRRYQIIDSYKSSYKVPEQYVSESPDLPLLLVRSRNANLTERSGWSGGALFVTELPSNRKVGYIDESAMEVNGTVEKDSLFVTEWPQKDKETKIVKRANEIGNTMETANEQTLAALKARLNSSIIHPGHLEVTKKPKRGHMFSMRQASRLSKIGLTMGTTAEGSLANDDETNVIEDGELNTMSLFQSQLLEWYLSLTSKPKIMIAAGSFESKAVEFARSLKLNNFRPTKVWLKEFLGLHGMWCTLRDKRVLFLEPIGGLLKARFDVEFEAWYHTFPISPDYIIDYEHQFNEIRVNANKYLTDVFDWYVSQTSSVSALDILSAEANFARMAGLTDIHVQSIKDYYSNWCFRHGKFYESVEEAYSLCLPVLVPAVLKKVAVCRAREFGLSIFDCKLLWMKRYLQLNGLIYREGKAVNCYKLDPTNCSPEALDRIFQRWQACSRGRDIRLQTKKWLRLALNELVPEKVVPHPSDEVIVIKDDPDPPLKIVSSFTLSGVSTLKNE